MPVLESDVSANVKAVTEGGGRLTEKFSAGGIADHTRQFNHTIDKLAPRRERAAMSPGTLALAI